MRLFFRTVRAAVVAACLLPCAAAGVLAVRGKVSAPPPKACSIEATSFTPTSSENKSSSVVVAKLDRKYIAFVADADEQEIVAYDTKNGRVLARQSVGGSPSHLLLDKAGRLYVTVRDANVVRVFEPSATAIACGAARQGVMLHPIAELATAAEPVALAEMPDGQAVLAVTGWGHTLEAFSKKTNERTFMVSLPREPRAVVVDSSGRHAFVSHAMGPPSIVDLDGRRDVRRIAIAPEDGSPGELVANVRLSAAEREGFDFGFFRSGLGGFDDFDAPRKPKPVKPRTPTQGFALASFEGRVLAPEVLVQPGEMPPPTKHEAPVRPTGYGSFGSTEGLVALGPATAHIAVVEPGAETVLSASARLVVDDRSCLLPRAAAIDPDRKTLLVACLGTNEVAEFDARSKNPTRAFRGRFLVPAGPTGLAVFDDRIAVWSSFDRVLTIIGRDTDIVHASTTTNRRPTPFEVGRKVFHASGNSAISSDGRACASCHPDGRDDGLTWSSPDGPRQTPMLAGRLAETAPFGWTGASATVREHLQQTLKRLEGRGLNDRATYALLTYLSRMKTPARSPIRDPEVVARGRSIFNSYEAGCSGCHAVKSGKPIGDGDIHDVGSKARGDVGKELATPSLEFVGGTAPYFHDGRYATLDDLLKKTDGKMGSTGHLHPADRDALASYLESL
jgi:DNA-binding beta-propeller fold protein YncE/mono/diheme cytochrome c family protein